MRVLPWRDSTPFLLLPLLPVALAAQVVLNRPVVTLEGQKSRLLNLSTEVSYVGSWSRVNGCDPTEQSLQSSGDKVMFVIDVKSDIKGLLISHDRTAAQSYFGLGGQIWDLVNVSASPLPPLHPLPPPPPANSTNSTMGNSTTNGTVGSNGTGNGTASASTSNSTAPIPRQFLHFVAQADQVFPPSSSSSAAKYTSPLDVPQNNPITANATSPMNSTNVNSTTVNATSPMNCTAVNGTLPLNCTTPINSTANGTSIDDPRNRTTCGYSQAVVFFDCPTVDGKQIDCRRTVVFQLVYSDLLDQAAQYFRLNRIWAFSNVTDLEMTADGYDAHKANGT